MIAARQRFRLTLLTLATVLALVGTTGASASPPTSVSGTFTTTSAAFNNARLDGGNSIYDLTATITYTGAFSGTSIVQGTLIIHADGNANFHDVETFTGTVNGVPGTVTFNLEGTGSVVPPAGSYRGSQTVTSGTGDLSNLRGVIKQVGTVPGQSTGPLGTYDGQIQFGKP
jgi:hypothetical protein